jgi:hypothetical protein
VSWQSLKGRLDSLPLVLAGPILRQVTTNAVTVWFALLKPANVSLRVFESGSPGSPLMATGTAPNTDPAATTAIGKNLHIVAATVRSVTPLVPGKTYCYDATFVTNDAIATTQKLAQAITAPGATPPAKPFTYDPFDFPSFALPPQDLNSLRLVHGSCRKPHGGTLKAATNPTPDQLATLDGLIATDASDPTKRPHQLLLTGDQIYADDVDDELLASLTDASDALLGWSGTGEILPSADPTTHAASALAPGSRVEVISSAGFTGDDRRSHLLSLGEFFAMYLFVWSDALWSDTMTYDQFELILNVTLSAHPDWKVPDTLKSEYADRQAAVQTFRKTLPAVRRALANIPTYMILDDHEVSDDFNMTRNFVNQVYADELGVRVVQNGLTAFAVCQAWGNVPEQFDPKTPTAAGTQLLALLAKVAGATDTAGAFEMASDTIQTLVGVHQIGQMKDTSDGAPPNSIHAFHEGAATDTVTVNGVAVNTKSLRYNFTVEGPAHQVLVTDTRTWRGFTGDNSLPTLLYGQLPDQIINAKPPLGERLQLLVCSTNAPPIAQIRLLVHAGGAQWATTLMRRKKTPQSAIDFWDIPDSWDFPSRDFDEMIAAVTTRLAQRDGTIVAPLVILSGDVHFSFSSRMGYWATSRLGDTTPQAVNIAIAQLVSSSLKNEANGTRDVELGGYGNADPASGQWLKLAPYLGVTGGAMLVGLTLGAIALFGGKSGNALKDSAIGAAAGALIGLLVPFILFGRRLPPNIAEAYVGWNIPRNGPDKLIAKLTATSSLPFKVTGASPTYDQNLNGSGLTNALITPDYRYRLDYLLPNQGGETTPVTPPPSLPAAGATPAQWAQSFAATSNARTDAVSKNMKLPDVVGHNAIGDIRFVWPKTGDALAKTGKVVQHRLHWQTPGPSGIAMWDEYDVPLDNTINNSDTTYKDLTVEIAP